jgi:hypothetical protein
MASDVENGSGVDDSMKPRRSWRTPTVIVSELSGTEIKNPGIEFTLGSPYHS